MPACLKWNSELILLALLSIGIFYLLRLERVQLVFVVGICLLGCSGCQSFTNVFSRRADAEFERARQLANGGLKALDRGKLEQAKASFSQALEHAPKDRRIRTHLVDALVQKGEYDQAISHMLRVVESSKDPRQNVALGELYIANGQWLQAVRQAEVALSRNRKLPAAWVLKGKTHFVKGEYREAIGYYQKALGFQPEMPEVQLQVAEAYRMLEQPMRALATLEQLAGQYPVDQQPEAVLVAKGIALMEVQQLDEAIDLLARTTQRENASVDAFVQLGHAQFLAGRSSEARTTLNRAQTLFPERDDLRKLAQRIDLAPRQVVVQSQER